MACIARSSDAKGRCIPARNATLTLDCVMAKGMPCRVKSDGFELVPPRASAEQAGGLSTQSCRGQEQHLVQGMRLFEHTAC